LQRACRACAAFAEDRRGWAWVDWWPDDWRPETPPLPHLHLSRGVKAALDPRGILNPGRYWGHW
jgi:FAD/FMN-containing dehydrogenase